MLAETMREAELVFAESQPRTVHSRYLHDVTIMGIGYSMYTKTTCEWIHHHRGHYRLYREGQHIGSVSFMSRGKGQSAWRGILIESQWMHECKTSKDAMKWVEAMYVKEQLGLELT